MKLEMLPFANATEHLLAELQRLDLMLQRQVLRLRAANMLTPDEFRGLYIPDAQVDALLREKRAPTTNVPREGDELADIAALTVRVEQLRVEIDARAQASLRAGIDLPLPRLTKRFGLEPFEVEVLLIGAAPELALRYETLYAYAQNDVTKKRPTVDLALQLLCATLEERWAQRAVFASDGALLRHQLLRLFDDPQDREPPLLARFIKADARVVDFLLGDDKIDSALRPFVRRLKPTRRWSELALPPELIARLENANAAWTPRDVVFSFQGARGVGKQAAAEAMCAKRGLPLLAADLGQALASEVQFAQLVGLLRREAMLQNAALYLHHFDALASDEPHARVRVTELAHALADFDLPIFLASETPWQPTGLWQGVSLLRFEFPLPAFPLRFELWQQALNGNSQGLAEEVDIGAVANKFILSAGQIADAAREAKQLSVLRVGDQSFVSAQDLHAAARDQANQDLRRLAQKIEPLYGWSDIVLPPRAMRQLAEVLASVKYHHVVYSRWGFERKLALGKGLQILFSGPSGTGKTMAAEILARELGLDLYKIDLSSVVSKYIGETEKNLASIFREAQASNAILFFDEADALFGKRSEVKDAHDRYANIEVAYLLQKMDEYEGMVILATNLSKNLDEAFARRMHHTVEFPFPDAAHRERIWRGMFPPEAPLAEDVEFGFLARQFELSGGNIRNVALAAAFMAAEDGGTIRMEHLIRATARELQKIGKLPSRADFRDYYELIREV